MKCPLDGTELENQIYEKNIEIDKCPKCGGVWLDPGELEAIQEAYEKDHSGTLSQQPEYSRKAYEMELQKNLPDLDCPKCGTEMIKKEYGLSSQIIIDTCLDCRGIWLDKGELEALEVFYERVRNNTPELSRLSLLWMGIQSFFSKGKNH
ncbi:MAG: zf-TFIIB domain-containing protein [Myxococcota bacterium]